MFLRTYIGTSSKRLAFCSTGSKGLTPETARRGTVPPQTGLRSAAPQPQRRRRKSHPSARRTGRPGPGPAGMMGPMVEPSVEGSVPASELGVVRPFERIEFVDEGAFGRVDPKIVAAAQAAGARRKFVSQGEQGLHVQWSTFPPGYRVAPHSHS